MLGAIIGDCIGSSREFDNVKTLDFDIFPQKSTYTDDTILTVATADAILNNKQYSDVYYEYFKNYPNRGWGGSFSQVIHKYGKLVPYDSYGNGSAMRVSPVGWYCKTEDETLEEAKKTAEVSHNNEEGIKGAQAVALVIFLSRNNKDKKVIMEKVANLGYDLNKKLKEFKRNKFDVTCQGTIPICMAIFNETNNFEDAMKFSVIMGGDVDTNAAIVGSIAEAYYKEIPEEFERKAILLIPKKLRDIVIEFNEKYMEQKYKIPKLEEKEELVDLFKDLFTI